MGVKFPDLCELLEKRAAKRAEHEELCSNLLRQFAQGFIDKFDWPANLIHYFPLEGNRAFEPNERPHFNTHMGPGSVLHFADGHFHVGLRIRLIAPQGQALELLQALAQGISFLDTKSAIRLSVQPTHITFDWRDCTYKVNRNSPDLHPIYDNFIANLSEYLNSEYESKPNKFGFYVNEPEKMGASS
jgi:hypothetical protein